MKYFLRFVSGINPINKQHKQLLTAFNKINHHTADSDTVVREHIKTIIHTANSDHPRCKPATFSVHERSEGIYFFVYSGNYYANIELIRIKGAL